MQKLVYLFFLCLNFSISSSSSNPENYEGSSNLINLQYHMGPILASPINIYIIWYGNWNPTHQSTIKDFIHSFSTPAPFPSVYDWWKTVQLYADQSGANITSKVALSGEYYDTTYSHGKLLTRLSMQEIINRAAVSPYPRPLTLSSRNGLYLILTSSDVQVQEFCRAVCGFHYFTFPNIVGMTVPFLWVGYSGKQCPGMCAYPFAWPEYSGKPPPNGINGIMKPPNGDAGVDGMISVLAHELAEVSSNPLVNAWYAGDDPTAPTEIADLCLVL